MSCRLQINERGSWRNVMHFKPERLEMVKTAAELLQSASLRITFRIVEDDLPRLYMDKNGNWKHWGN